MSSKNTRLNGPWIVTDKHGTRWLCPKRSTLDGGAWYLYYGRTSILVGSSNSGCLSLDGIDIPNASRLEGMGRREAHRATVLVA